VKWCKHPGCLKRAIVYKRDGIRIVACKEHFRVIIEYLRHLEER